MAKRKTKSDQCAAAPTNIESVINMSVQELDLVEPLNSLFRRNEKVKATIRANMKTRGYDRAFPLIAGVIPGFNNERPFLVDGHNRRDVWLEIGHEEPVPTVIHEFGRMNDAIKYALENQGSGKRQLDDAERIHTIDTLMRYKKKLGRPKKIGTNDANFKLGKLADEWESFWAFQGKLSREHGRC